MLRLLFITVVILVLSSNIYADTYKLTGRVISNNKPIIGANIVVSNTKTGSITGKKGTFTISNLQKGNYTLKVSSIGCISKEIQVYINNADVQVDDIDLQEDFLKLENVIITATRSEVLRKDAPIQCSLIDQKIIKATQSVVLSEGLSFQPALRIENNCQNCGFSGLRMNGLESAYSQILIDGRPIFSSLQGVYGLEQIPTNMIERVEVVRSGGSSLYGSSAIAGTVNIITKEPQTNTAYCTTNQAWIDGKSNDQTYMIGTDIVNDEINAGISIHGFNRNRSQWDMNNDGFSEIGQIRATSVSMKTFYKPSELSKIICTGFTMYEFRRGGNKFDQPFHKTDITESTTHNILNAGITYEQFTESKLHKFSSYLQYQLLDRDSYYGSGFDENAYGISIDRSLVCGLQYSGTLGEIAGGTHTVVSGLEYNSNTLKDLAPSYNRLINQKAAQLGLYFQDLCEYEDIVNILVGGRLDYHNLVGIPVFSPRVNVLYKISPDIQGRIGYAKGFRAPQVFDEDLHISQVNSGGIIIKNKEDLQPEYSHAFSGSLDINKYLDDWSVGVTIDVFNTTLNNVFILEKKGLANNGDILLERRNGNAAYIAGITINPKIQYKKTISFQCGYTFQNSIYDIPVQWSNIVENNNSSFFRTPNHYGFYVISWNLNQLVSLNFSGVYTGSMIAQHYAGFINQDVLNETPSFFENNIKIDIDHQFNSSFDVTMNIGVQNFTNAFQKDFDIGIKRDAGYVYGPSRPRTYFLGLSIKM